MSLAGVKGAKNLRIAFVGTTDGGQDVYIDNVAIANATTTDLEVTSFAAPRRIARGENVAYSVKVTNLGGKAAGSYTGTRTVTAGISVNF